MNSTSIVVLVVTHNNVDEIDKTWESIQAQNYPKENIWTCFVDFDSTDGTYEKILSYDRPYRERSSIWCHYGLGMSCTNPVFPYAPIHWAGTVGGGIPGWSARRTL